MPENKSQYIIQLGDRALNWDAEKMEKNSQKLASDFPDAQIYQIDDYDVSEEPDKAFSYIVNIGGRNLQWDAGKLARNKEKLASDFPDAKIQKVSAWQNPYVKSESQIAKENLDAFREENGAFLDGFEARDTAERRMATANAMKGIVVPPTEGGISGEERGRYIELSKQEEDLKKAYYNSPDVVNARLQRGESISTMQKDIEKALVSLNENTKAYAPRNHTATLSGLADENKEDRGNYVAAQSLLDDAIKINNAPSRYVGNFFTGIGNFFKGAGNTFSDVDFWTAGLTEIAENFKIRDVLSTVQEKLGSLNDLSEQAIDDALTDSEKKVLTAYLINADVQLDRAEDLSRAFQAGQGAAESAGFMAEFILTGGWSTGARKVVKAGAKKVLGDYLGKLAGKVSKTAVGKYGRRLAGDAIEAAARTLVMPSTYRNMSQQAIQIKEDPETGERKLASVSDYVAKGFADSFIEALAEGGRVGAIGGFFGDILGSIKPAKKLIDTFKKSDIATLVKTLNNTEALSLLRAGGWHGIGEEYLEEWYGVALRTITNLEPEALKDFATVDNQLITLTSFLPMTIIGGGFSTGRVLKAKKDVEKNAALLKSAMAEQGYSEEQANLLVDSLKNAPMQALSDTFTPMIIKLAEQNDDAPLFMKYVARFAFASAKAQAFGAAYEMQEARQRDNLRTQIEETTGKPFWQEDTEGNRFVETAALGDGTPIFILNHETPTETPTEQGTSILGPSAMGIDENGNVHFVNDVESEVSSLDDYLNARLMERRGAAERERILLQTEQRINDIKSQIVLNQTVLNMGTQENPIEGLVVGMTANGVMVQTQEGATPLTWDEVGNKLSLPNTVMTDAQIEEAEVANLDAQQAAREAMLDEQFDDPTAEEAEIAEGEEAEAAAEEATYNYPRKADGSVDGNALWNENVREWIKWNNQRIAEKYGVGDNGADSINYLQNQIASLEKSAKRIANNKNKETDLDKRMQLEDNEIAVNKRLAELRDILAEVTVGTAEEVVAETVAEETPAEPAPEVSETPSVNEDVTEETMESSQSSARQTVIDLYNDAELTEDEIEEYIKANLRKAQSELDKHASKAPKMGTDIAKYKADKAKHAQKTAELEQQRNFWKEVQSYVEVPTTQFDMEPQNALEFTAKELASKEGIKLLPDSFKRHTGWGSEIGKFLSILRTKEKGGLTLEAAGERLMELDRENSTGFFYQSDPNAGLNAILDVLGGARTSGDISSYIKANREQTAKEEVAAARNAMMEEVAEETQNKNAQPSYQLSDEVDENGRQFVLTSDGSLSFGEITDETGLTPAPILLSEGLITNPATNDGYGLVHIEARHGDQIRNAGYSSVVEFVEEVAKNYEVIREGKNRDGHQTYMLQLTDKHNNTLMVELSGDGTYWNINTAGIFKTSYGANRKEVYNRHTTDKQSVETVEASQVAEQSDTQPTSSMNAPTTPSEDKDSNIVESAIESEEKVEDDFTFESSLDEDMPDFTNSASAYFPTAEMRQKFSAMRARINEWAQKLGVQVRIMETLDDVVNQSARREILMGGKVYGYFDPATGEVAFYLPDFLSIKGRELTEDEFLREIDATYIHEVVSHRGLRGLLGEEKFGELCDNVWEFMSEEERAKYMKYPGVNGNTRVAADEFIAHFAESVRYNDNRTLWDKIVDFIRNILPLDINIESNEDIAILLRQSYANLAKNAEAATNANANLQAEGNTMFRSADGSLVGMHNISEDKLRKVIKQGGSANPSTGVIDIERQTFNSHGEISLIMPSSLVDAGTGRNAGTFTADAWTPTYPPVSRRFSDDKLQRAYWRDTSAIPEEMSHEVRMAFDSWLDYRTANGLSYMFLHERGEAPEMVRVAAKFPQEIKDKLSAILGEGRSGLYRELSDEEKQAVLDLYIQENFGGSREDFDKSIADHIQRIEDRLSTGKVPSFVEKRITLDLQWMKEHGYNYDHLSSFVKNIVSDIRHAGEVDDAATTTKALDYIKDNGLEKEYDEWKESLNDRYGIKEYLFAGYTPSGNQRWLPNTVENASKLMNKEGLAGATGLSVGFNRFVATLVPKKKSLSDIRASKDRLVEDRQLVDDFSEKWSDVFFDLGVKCQPGAPVYEDYGHARLTEAAQKKNPGAYLKKEYGVELSQEDLQKLDDMIKAIKTEFPTNYFETKFQRPVYLNEFAASVMPTTTSEDVKQAVAEAGLPIYEYDSAVEGSRREATLKATEGEGIRFRTEQAKNRVESLFNDAVKGTFRGKPVSLGTLTAEGKQYLESISGLTFKNKVDFMLNASDLVHMYNEHFGANEKDPGSNIPLTIDDIRNIVDVILKPERVLYLGEDEGKRFAFLAPADSGAYNLIEVYTTKKGNLSSKTFYKTKKGVSHRAMILEKESQHSTSKMNGATLSDAKIPILFDIANQEDGNLTMHSVPVTEEMKSSVMEGQVMFRARREDESAMEFHQAVVDEHKSRYNDIAEMEVFPINEATAKRFGYTLDELQKSSGLYVSSEDLIAIFANEDETDSIEIEDTIFHESIHKLVDFFDHLKAVGEWMWSVADKYTLFAGFKKHIEQEYSENEYAEEMMCSMLGGVMPRGLADELLSRMPENIKKNCEQIFNEIGYDRRRESIARVLRYDDESAVVSEVVPEASGEDEGRRRSEEKKEGSVRYRAEIVPEVQDEMDAIHASAIVMGNFMKAPNGKDTNLTEEQWLMVRTKGFKNWFGDWLNDPENASKVVDENGEPKVVYHGTLAKNLTQFDKDFVGSRYSYDEKGFFFISRESIAKDYATPDFGTGQGTIIPAFINLKNPLSVNQKWATKNGLGSRVFKDNDVIEFWDNYQTLMIEESENNDGVIISDGTDLMVVAFEPSQIKSANENIGEFSTEDDDIRYRTVTDQETLDRLNSEPTIKVYRAMQVIDGKLYPPMSAKVDGKLREPIELGQWEEAEERPDLADDKGRFKLDKGNKTSIPARYNPYFHTSRTPLNDQFSSAQTRPNLVTVEVEVPESELSSGYKAEKAKDTVGEKEWKAGVVQGKLSGTRKVILSRWDKPVRIVPDDEVADRIVEMLEGKDITMPSNVVTPSLREELEKRGVPFVETDNQGRPVEDVRFRIYGPSEISSMETPVLHSKGAFANLAEAEDWAKDNLQGETATNRFTGDDISISGRSIEEMLSPKITKRIGERVHVAALQSVLDFIETGIPAELHPDTHGRGYDVMRLYNAIVIDGEMYRVKSTVKRLKDGDRYYTYELQEMELIEDTQSDAFGMGSRTALNSINSITGAKLLKGVKKTNSSDYILQDDEVRFRSLDAVPAEEVIEEGLDLADRQVAELAGNLFEAFPYDIRKKITDSLNGDILGLKDAVLQIPASLAAKEEWNDEDREIAGVIAREVQSMIYAPMKRSLSASEALWMLYDATHRNPSDIVEAAQKAFVKDRLGFSDRRLEEKQEMLRFRAATQAEIDAMERNMTAADLYNRDVTSAIMRLRESFQDMYRSVQKMMDAIVRKTGKAVEPFEDIMLALNQLSSKNLADKGNFIRKFLMPMWDAVLAFKENGHTIEDVTRYVMLKHGLERNDVLAQRDARNYYKDAYDKKVRDIEADKSLSDAEKKDKKNKAKDDFDFHLASIESGSDAKYRELRERDYGAVMALYADYVDIPDRMPGETIEQFNQRQRNARRPKFTDLAVAEAEAAREVDAFENANRALCDRLWKSINAATKETLKHQYEHNVISKQAYDHVKGMFKFYVPLRGFKEDTAEDIYSYYGKDISTDFAAPLIRTKGRTTLAESPFGWIGSMAESAIQMDNKNDAKMRLYYFAVNRPEQNLLTLQKTWYKKTGEDADGRSIWKASYPDITPDMDYNQTRQEIERHDAEMKALAASGQATQKKSELNLRNSVVNISDKAKPEHAITVLINGEEQVMYVNGNPRAAQAINGKLNIDNAGTGGLLGEFYRKVGRGVTRWMAQMNTSYNPTFWLSNYERDLLTSIMNISVNEGKEYLNLWRENYVKPSGVMKLLRKYEKGELDMSNPVEKAYKEFADNGGVTGFTVLANNEEYDKLLEKYARDAERSKFIKGAKSVFGAIQDFGEGVEQASRFSVFITSRQLGRPIEQAIGDAKDVTVNFNRKGSGHEISWEETANLSFGHAIDSRPKLKWCARVLTWMVSGLAPAGRTAYMFFNASIQGLRLFLSLYKKHPKKMAMWSGAHFGLSLALVGLNHMINSMLDGDDDDYLDIPDWERRNNILIGGDGFYLKWAIPQEVRPIYALADIVYNKMVGRSPDEKLYVEIPRALFEVLPVNPLGEGGFVRNMMPSIFTPIYDIRANTDYKGMPLYRESYWSTGEEPKYDKAFSGTGKVFVEISRLLNEASGGDYAEAGAINIHPAAIEHLIEGYGGGTVTFFNQLLKTLTGNYLTGEWTVRNTPFLNRVVTINDERYRNSHTSDVFKHYENLAKDTKRIYNVYKSNDDVDKIDEMMDQKRYDIMKIYERHSKKEERYDDLIRDAEDERERRELMAEQDEIRREMIKEISEL